jgi:hypothetical protein
MISFQIGTLQVNFELRRGVPLVYFERYREPSDIPGSQYETVILGLPGVSIEASRLRRS